MYVAVKGGERAIVNAHRWLEEARRGDPAVPEISLEQIGEQLGLAVDRVMGEGSLYDRELAALAVKQARGDLIEAIFLVRAYRTTLPRFGYSEPLDAAKARVRRRISAAFKDLPGGQILGPTFDYTHRIVDFGLADAKTPRRNAEVADRPIAADIPRVVDLLGAEGLIEAETPAMAAGDAGGEPPVGDITRESLAFPAARDVRLQRLARGDEGFLLALGYSTQRGYGRTHPFAGEIRFGAVPVEYAPPELGFAVEIGDIEVTECQTINQFKGSAGHPPQFSRGYGLVFGQCERKAMSMALVDRALRAGEFGEERTAPAQDEEFVLSHADSVEATGFVEHLKMPHYVDFQSELELVRRLRAEAEDEGRDAQRAATG